MAGDRPSGSYLIAVQLEVTILESHISASIPETIPDSFPSSIAIPFVETERVNELRSVSTNITKPKSLLVPL